MVMLTFLGAAPREVTQGGPTDEERKKIGKGLRLSAGEGKVVRQIEVGIEISIGGVHRETNS
jgi:hypothetical protein